MTTLSVFAAHLDAGTWSVLKILSANDDPFVVFGAWQHWRVTCSQARLWRLQAQTCVRDLINL